MTLFRAIRSYGVVEGTRREAAPIPRRGRVPAAIELARLNGINLAISNPCVELWFILHFEAQTAHIDRGTAQRRSGELLKCDKVLTELALADLVERHDIAKSRAIGLDEKHRGDGSAPGSNPSTSMWRLIELIRGA